MVWTVYIDQYRIEIGSCDLAPNCDDYTITIIIIIIDGKCTYKDSVQSYRLLLILTTDHSGWHLPMPMDTSNDA